MKTLTKILLPFLLFSSSPILLFSQSTASEYTRTFATYPYGDPNPVARPGKIYPYFRFDGFSTKSVNKDWKIVELENAWIRVMIAPEMGGKILGGFEKSTGQEFIYFNKVVKFRDIAMRGAWTSGGIEFNFGSIGHAPTTASPVDYLVKPNPDGSISCWIGAMDLSSRTEWRVEIRLPGDKAYVETNIFWYNPMELSSSKYHWATAAADAAPDLKYIFPGDHFIGHGGEESPWPILKDGRNISNYAENDYGADHSYHVLGTYSDYFAGYYSTRNFGFGHLNDYPEKLGKKIWIWALSPQGALWTDLLTDKPGNMQYTEIQTGILFNQEAAGSTYTPFKHMAFPSNTCERFSEYWFPVVGTGGASEITRSGILNVTPDKVRFSPLEFVKDKLTVVYPDGSSESIDLDLKPLQLFEHNTGSKMPKEIRIGTRLRWSEPDQAARDLDRPVVSPSFDWSSLQGLYLQAIEYSRQREYSQARDYFRKCLAKDARYIPALTGLAEEYIRILKPSLAEELLQTALGLDTYDPKANYLYGVVKETLGAAKVTRNSAEPGAREFYQAKEAFGISARSMEYRSAAYTEIAGIGLIEGQLDRALKYAVMAQDYNRYSIKAIQFEIIARRLLNQKDAALAKTNELLALDPLNHFGGYEKYIQSQNPSDLESFKSLIRNEFPDQTYLELAIFYHSVGQDYVAANLLSIAPKTPEVEYWKNYLIPLTPFTSSTNSTISTSSTKFSFPWRPETLRVIEQAETRNPDWRNRYYMGLIRWNLDDSTGAKELFRSCGTEPQEAHFYLTRARLFAGTEDALVLSDLDLANKLEPGEWRTWQALTAYYMNHRAWAQALDISRRGTAKIPGHMILQFDQAKAELYNHQYDNCLDILDKLILLPAEGAREGHEIFRSALILRSLDYFRAKKYNKALKDLEKARTWPETLGVGKPYVTDERIEDYITGVIFLEMDRHQEAAKYLQAVVSWTEKNKPAWDSPYVLAALSQVLLNKETEGDRILNDWMKIQPASPLMLWSVAAYSNNASAAEKALTRLGWKPEETPWGLGDAQLPLVYEVVKKVVVK
jgi:tetratricopeptide (TPR) repeat protein